MAEYFKCLQFGKLGPVTRHPWIPGEWQEVTGRLVACRHGFHVVNKTQVFRWGSDELWRVEIDPQSEKLTRDDKTVVRRMRITKQITGWNARNLRLFAADCIERVLPVFEWAHPGDGRLRRVTAAARAFARGEISGAALADASLIASQLVDVQFADLRVDDVRVAASEMVAAHSAGWAAARAAVRSAARLSGWAGGDTTRDAEIDWQIDHLWSTYLTPGGTYD